MPLRRVAALFNPATAAQQGQYYWLPFEGSASKASLEPVATPVQSEAEIDTVLASAASVARTGLVVMPDLFTVRYRKRIIAAAASYHLPAIYPYRYFAREGGLLGYGIDLMDQYRGAATYVDHILRGERVSEMPVQGPAKFELAINSATARALGLTIPLAVLARADEVIE